MYTVSLSKPSGHSPDGVSYLGSLSDIIILAISALKKSVKIHEAKVIELKEETEKATIKLET